MRKTKMLKTKVGSCDGIRTELFKADNVYTTGDELAQVFIDNEWAVDSINAIEDDPDYVEEEKEKSIVEEVEEKAIESAPENKAVIPKANKKMKRMRKK